MAGSATVQIHFTPGQHGCRARTTNDTRTEVYISSEVMTKIPTARTTLLRMVQLFIEGIAMPVNRQWREAFNSRGLRRSPVPNCSNQVRQDDPLHPKPLSRLPTYVMWGLTDDELGRLEEEDGYATARRDAAIQGLRGEIARLQNETSTLVRQLSDQDTLIADMMAQLERMEMPGTYTSSFVCCAHLTMCPHQKALPVMDPCLLPHLLKMTAPSRNSTNHRPISSTPLRPMVTHPTIPSVTVVSHNDTEMMSQHRDTAAWRRRSFGTQTTQYMHENALHSAWNLVLHKIAYEHAPAEWGRCLFDVLTQGQSEGVAGVRLNLAFGLADAMCADSRLTLEYDDLQGRYY